MTPIKVLVVDDHALVRQGIISVVSEQEGLKVVGEASDGLEAVKIAKEVKPDLVLMDLKMPNSTGLEATKVLIKEMPHLNILILTISDKAEDLFNAIKFGAKGYLLKNIKPKELINAIFHVADGGIIISPKMATMLLNEFNEFKYKFEKEPIGEIETNLSPREVEVLQLVARGATNKEISISLFISENTVKTHLRNILEKLHLVNRSQATAYAIKKGILTNNK